MKACPACGECHFDVEVFCKICEHPLDEEIRPECIVCNQPPAECQCIPLGYGE